jgi:hypothetical protein
MLWLLIIVIGIVLVGFVTVVGVRRQPSKARASQRRQGGR